MEVQKKEEKKVQRIEATLRRGTEPRLILNTKELAQDHPAKTEMPAALLRRVVGPMREHHGVQALTAGRLQSGDVFITLATEDDVRRVCDDAEEAWIKKAFIEQDAQPVVRRAAFPEHRSLVIHGVAFDLGEEGIKSEVERLNNTQVAAVRYLIGRRRREQMKKEQRRAYGSVVVAFKTANERDRLLRVGRVSCGNLRCIAVRYDAGGRLQQCNRCQRLGHVARHCRQNVACRICAGSHDTNEHRCKQCPAASTAAASACNHIPTKRSATIVQSLLNNPADQEYDIICVQEPFARYDSPVGHPRWESFGHSGQTVCDLDLQRQTQLPPHPRVLTYVNKKIQVAQVSEVGVRHPDLLSINLSLRVEGRDTGQVRDIVITNLYNPVRSADTIPVLEEVCGRLRPEHHLIVGDFNAHHSLWETQVRGTSRYANEWVETMLRLGLHIITPRDTPTYESAQGRHSTIDLALVTEGLEEKVIRCKSLLDREPGEGSDHFPVETVLNLQPIEATAQRRFNMKKCDEERFAAKTAAEWNEFAKELPDLHDGDAVERWAEAVQRCIVAGLEESTPRARLCGRSQPWFDHNASRRDMNQKRRIWQKKVALQKRGVGGEQWKDEVEDAKRIFDEARRSHHSSIAASKRSYKKQALAEAGPGEVWKLAKIGSRGRNATNVAPLRDRHGQEAQDPGIKAMILRQGLWPTPVAGELDPDQDSSFFSEDAGEPAFEWEPFTQREVAERIGRAKDKSAPGPDAITWPALKILMRRWNGFVPMLRALFDACLRHGRHPRVFKKATTVILRKPGKPDYSVPGAYRPIALLNTLGKLLEALVAARILAHAENASLLSPNHFGGRPGRSTEDALLRLQQFVQDQHRRRRHVLLVSLDVSGAYNGVRERPLVADLQEAGWPKEAVDWTASFMRERETEIRIGDYTDPFAPIPDGLPQGSPFSQVAWVAYSRGLADAVGGQGPRRQERQISIAWVDDENAAFAHENVKELGKMAQTFLDQASEWARAHKAQFDGKKSQVCLMLRPKAQPIPEPPQLILSGRPLPMASEAKVLGVTFQADGKFHKHASNVVAKCAKAVNALMGQGNRAWGFGIDNARLLYQVGVLPMMMYASTVWVKPRGVTGSGRALKELAKVQRLAAIRITGAYKSTSTAALNFEAGLLPVDLKIQERHQMALIRMMRLPETHPLTQAMERAGRTSIQRIPGPLDLLLRAYPDVAKARLTRKLTKACPERSILTAAIAATKEQAVKDHDQLMRQSMEKALLVYTDGSGEKGRFGGASAVMNGYLVEGGHDAVEVPLGTNSTVFKAELLAIKAAMAKIPEGQAAIIWSDSQAALKAINSNTAQDPDVRAVQDRWMQLGSNVKLAWVPGHFDVAGNEAADGRAKAAAAMPGPSEQADEEANVRRAVKERSRAEWQERWDAEEAKGKLLRRVNTLRVGETAKLYRGLSRPTVSILVQLRTGHIGLNRYLHDRRLADDGRCERCHQLETREHILLSCSRTRRARRGAERDLGWSRATSTRYLLNDKKAAVHAARIAALRLRAYQEPESTAPRPGLTE